MNAKRAKRNGSKAQSAHFPPQDIKKMPRRAGHAVRRPRRIEPDTRDEESVDGQYVSALARGLEILQAFRLGETGIGNHELAERTGFTKPTISRITHTLSKLGFLTYNPRQSTYGLGGSALALGYIALSSINVGRMARGIMQELADESGFNVGLGIQDRHMMIYTETCQGKALVGLILRRGSRIPIATTAMGRAYLAALPEDDRELLLEELSQHYGQKWPALFKGIKRALNEIKEKGFCTSLGDWQPDIHGVAAPIRMPDGYKSYALNLGGPKYLLPEAKVVNEYGPRIAKMAMEIEGSAFPLDYGGGSRLRPS